MHGDLRLYVVTKFTTITFSAPIYKSRNQKAGKRNLSKVEPSPADRYVGSLTTKVDEIKRIMIKLIKFIWLTLMIFVKVKSY